MGNQKDFLLNVGERIRKIRKQKHLSIEELSDRCSLHYNYVGDIERGNRNISIKSLLKISKGLGIPVEEFFKSNDNLPNKPIQEKIYPVKYIVKKLSQEVIKKDTSFEHKFLSLCLKILSRKYGKIKIRM